MSASVSIDLLLNAVGEENAKTTDQIAVGIGEAPTRQNNPIRDAARDLALTYELPVCSGPRGFWVARERPDILPQASALERRAEKIVRRANAMKNWYEHWYDIFPDDDSSNN